MTEMADMRGGVGPGAVQTSLNPEDWYERGDDERRRISIQSSTPAVEKRELFPFSGILLQDDPAYNLKKGQYFKYARATLNPSPRPFRALAFDKDGRGRILMFNPEELGLLPADAPQGGG